MDIKTVLFGVYPYIVLVVFLLGCWLRFDYGQYTWKADSSQFLSKRYMLWASNLFHVGVLVLFFGHLGGLLTPHKLFLVIGISDLTHQYIAITVGIIFGLMSLTGALMLLYRRLTNSRVRATSRFMDIFILIWLIVTVSAGLSTIPVSIGHASEGTASAMVLLASWVQSALTMQADPNLLDEVDLVYKIHVLCGLTLFLLFPFSRLVHIWSAPLSYIFRAYQVVRTKRASSSA